MTLKQVSALDWRRQDDPGSNVVLQQVRVFDPRAGIDSNHDLVIRDGEIAELATPGSVAPAEGLEIIDCHGLWALPAFFDPHVHLRTPGGEAAEDLDTGTRAAAAGGYCGVIGMANTRPPVDTPADIRSLRLRARNDAQVPVGFVACATKGMQGEELTDGTQLADAGAVGISDDGLPIRSARIMRRLLQYQRITGLQIALHEEEHELAAGGSMHEGELSARLGVGGIPALSEVLMIMRDIELADLEDARIHVQHLSARQSVEVIARALERGVKVTSEATPHHLVLTNDATATLDANFKMNPPLRTEDDRQALIEGLRDGTITCIATDHAPHPVERKDVPFEEAAMGVTGLETAFPVIYTELVKPGVLDLGLVVDKMSSGAAAFDFEPPSLQVGSEANVTLFDPEADWIAGADGWESRSHNSCFTGRRMQGKTRMTIAAGRIAYRQREFVMGVAR